MLKVSKPIIINYNAPPVLQCVMFVQNLVCQAVCICVELPVHVFDDNVSVAACRPQTLNKVDGSLV